MYDFSNAMCVPQPVGIGVCIPDVGYEPADSPFIGKCWRGLAHFELTVFERLVVLA